MEERDYPLNFAEAYNALVCGASLETRDGDLIKLDGNTVLRYQRPSGWTLLADITHYISGKYRIHEEKSWFDERQATPSQRFLIKEFSNELVSRLEEMQKDSPLGIISERQVKSIIEELVK